MSASATALLRVREEMAERGITQRDLAKAMRCSQGRIAKIMNHGVNLRVDDLELLSQSVGLPLTETIRDRGLEFYAEMTPTEVRVLERLRQRPETLHALLTLLDIRLVPKVGTAKTKRGRPLDSSKGKSG